MSVNRAASRLSAQRSDLHNLHDLLRRLEDAAAEGEEVMLGHILDAIGRRSFAPILLITSLLGLTPLGGVPGVPTTLGVIIVFVAAQIVLGFDRLWLPRILLNRKVKGATLKKGARFLKPAARFVDKIIRPRLTFLTDRPYSYVLALLCLVLALGAPPLEVVPLVDIPLWGAMAAFSLALVAHDGLLAIVAFVLTGLSVYIIGTTLM
jgi:hypothetical protein